MMNTILPIHDFLNLKLAWEPHNYHTDNPNCIYQNLAKNNSTIRQIIFEIKNKYFKNLEFKLLTTSKWFGVRELYKINKHHA